MIVTIPYKTNQIGLASTLCMLQPQLKNTDAIYIVDNSVDKSGLKIAEMYGSSRLPIVIETGDYTIYESWNIGIEFMKDNKAKGILFLNDDLVIPETFIGNLKKAAELTCYQAIVPTTPNRAHGSRRLDSNFKWFNPTIPDQITNTKWLCGFAFYLNKQTIEDVGVFDTEYKIWFGDSDYERRLKKIGRLKNEYVYHFGASSFNYTDRKTLALIEKDRRHFVQIHGEKALSNC